MTAGDVLAAFVTERLVIPAVRLALAVTMFLVDQLFWLFLLFLFLWR
jgi:hypothetical protein